MKRSDLEKQTKEQLIEILMGATDLQVQLARLTNSLAKEIARVNDGEVLDLLILKGDDKLFEKLMTCVKMKNDFSLLSLLPQEEQAAQVGKLKPGDNMFEHAVKQVKKNGHSNI